LSPLCLLALEDPGIRSNSAYRYPNRVTPFVNIFSVGVRQARASFFRCYSTNPRREAISLVTCQSQVKSRPKTVVAVKSQAKFKLELKFGAKTVKFPSTSFQKYFNVGHVEAVHNTIGLKIVHQSRMTTKTEQMSLRVDGRDNPFSFQLLLSCKLSLL
jgi:hypothetical protein